MNSTSSTGVTSMHVVGSSVPVLVKKKKLSSLLNFDLVLSIMPFVLQVVLCYTPVCSKSSTLILSLFLVCVVVLRAAIQVFTQDGCKHTFFDIKLVPSYEDGFLAMESSWLTTNNYTQDK